MYMREFIIYLIVVKIKEVYKLKKIYFIIMIH